MRAHVSATPVAATRAPPAAAPPLHRTPSDTRVPRIARAEAVAPGGGVHRAQVAMVRQLQRTHGNRAAGKWLADIRPPPSQAAPSPVAPVASVMHVATSPARHVQRDAAGDGAWWQVIGFGETVAWRMAEEFAPHLTPILRKGPEGMMDWLKDRASQAAGAAFNGLLAPVRAIGGVGGKLSAQYAPMLAVLQESAVKIAANDCSPISRAADQIEKTATQILTPVVERVQPVIEAIQSGLSAAWDKVGAPVWEWIKDYAGQQWELVKQMASWVWQLSQPMRSLGADAWNWLKNKLGIGDGPEGENGVLQWVQAKFEAAWQRIKVALEPFDKQIRVVRAALSGVAGIFTGQISRVATLVSQIGSGLGWFASNLGKTGGGNALINARGYVEKSLIPALIDALNRAGGAVTGLAGTLVGAVGKTASGLGGAAGLLDGSALGFAAPLVHWIAGEVGALADWASQKLTGVASTLQGAIARFEGFLHSLVAFLAQVGGVIANVRTLPMVLAGKAWQAIPACIRDPVVDFVVPIILQQIELFSELVRDNDAWQKTKVQVMGIVRKIFVDRDLTGALKASFHLVLRVMNIPEDLLGKVAAKAMAAWDVVSKKPLEFIKNTVRSLGHGFRLMGANFLTHLEHGIEGWLFGELADKEIRPPESWTDPKAILGFVVDVLGLSTGHLMELLKKRIDPALVNKVQLWVGRFGRAWDWITNAIDTSRSPAENTRGLIAQAKDFGKSILKGIGEWIAGKVAEELAILATAAAASGGLSEVLDAARRVYKAMLTAKRWAGRILQMASDTLDHVLDIAGGNVSKVGAAFETIMGKAMPVVIGFLADQVGLGGIGAAIRNIVTKLRERVDAAILWLIDKIKDAIKAVAGGIRSGVEALSDWWTQRTVFHGSDGTPHTLYFKGGNANGELTVESSPMPVFEFLAKVLALIEAPDAQGKLDLLRKPHQMALRLANEVDRERATLQHATNRREPEHVAELNKKMNQLADAIQPLINELYPGTKKPEGLVAGAWIRLITTHDQIAIVQDFKPHLTQPQITMMHYRICNPKAPGWYRGKTPLGGATENGAISMSRYGQDFVVTVINAREAYLGSNPKLDSDEGYALFLKVAKRMVGQKKARFPGGVEDVRRVIILYGGEEYQLSECHLSHIIDAQAWWNANGRVTAPRSEVVRAFMEDPDNYELEPATPNLKRGGALSGPKTRYRPPIR